MKNHTGIFEDAFFLMRSPRKESWGMPYLQFAGPTRMTYGSGKALACHQLLSYCSRLDILMSRPQGHTTFLFSEQTQCNVGQSLLLHCQSIDDAGGFIFCISLTCSGLILLEEKSRCFCRFCLCCKGHHASEKVFLVIR